MGDNEYTPTTKEVRDGYRALADGLGVKRRWMERGEEFDRWLSATLSAHDAVKDRQIAELTAKVERLRFALDKDVAAIVQASVHTAAAVGSARLATADALMKMGYQGLRERAEAAEAKIAAASALADKWEHGATRWADPLPVPDEVHQLRAALTATGQEGN